MSGSIDVEAITIFVGVATLIVGVLDARSTHEQSLKQQNLQIILSISESFRTKWESGWSDILEALHADDLHDHVTAVPDKYGKDVRYMLNWVDWLGALKSSGAMEDLSILTASMGIPLKRIINAGRTIIEADVKQYGPDYWQNLLVIARHLHVRWAIELATQRK